MNAGFLAAVVLVLSSAAVGLEAAPEAQRDEWQYLSRYFTVDGFSEERPPRLGGFDGVGNSFSAPGLPEGDRVTVRSERYGPIEFLRPPTDGSKPNMVPCQGQEIRVTTKRAFNVLFFLGTAHHGDHHGWIELTFEDGTTGLGPFGLTDWYGTGRYGEEIAFEIPVIGPNENPSGRRGPSLWLQRTPVPREKRIVSIRLPNLPNASIVALTLGRREGIRPMEPPAKGQPGPGPVAIFGEPAFPHYNVRADLTPERIRAKLAEVGISATILGLELLKDPSVLSPDRYSVLIQPYGNTFPVEAEDTLRAYRYAGGAMVHFGVPFTQPIVRSPYGNWLYLGHTEDYLRHDGPHAMGTGEFVDCSRTEIVPDPALQEWGLDAVRWDEVLSRRFEGGPVTKAWPQLLSAKSLHPDDAVLTLLGMKSYEGDPLMGLVRHRGCAFGGAIDLWLGHLFAGREELDAPGELALEVVARGVGAILHAKGLMDADAWASISRPISDELRSMRPLEPIVPEEGWSGGLPEGRAIGRRVEWVDVSGRPDRERVLLASAQGLVHAAGGDTSVFLVDGPESRALLAWYEREGLVDGVNPVESDAVIERLGHRRCVVVDADLFGSLSLAVGVAAAEGVMVAYPEWVGPYRLEVAVNLSGLFPTHAACADFAAQTVWPRLERRCLAMIDPSPSSWTVLDYLIQRKIFPLSVAWRDDRAPAGASRQEGVLAATRLLAGVPVASPVLTVGIEEAGAESIVLLSKMGKYRVPVSGLPNLSFTSGRGFDEETAGPTKEAAPPPPAADRDLDEGTAYLASVRLPARGPRGLLPPDASSVAVAAASPRASTSVPLFLLDLAPACASRALSMAKERGDEVASIGLGEVDCDAFAVVFGDRTEEARQLFWSRVDRRMKSAGVSALVVSRWEEAGGAGIAACAAHTPSVTVLLMAPRSDLSLSPVEWSTVKSGKPVIHGLSSLDGAGAASIRPAFFWMPVAPIPTGVLQSELAGFSAVSIGDLARLSSRWHARGGMERIALIPSGATWKYDDSGTDLGSAWSGLDADDSGWKSGPAQLGYGQGGGAEKTVVSFGPNPREKHPTTYFRHAFSVDDPTALRSLFLEVVRDDGCVVYVNGWEAARSNLPEGDVAFGTFAVEAIGDDDESAWQRFEVKPSKLRKGTNVIAVEMHQATAASSDLSFDLRLTGVGSAEPGDAVAGTESPTKE